jgi:hypothetical protein
MDADKLKATAAAAGAQGQKVVQDLLSRPEVQAAAKKVAENAHVQKVLADPRVHEAYAKLSDPAVQRHFLTDLKAVLHGELPLKDAAADLKKVLTEAHVEDAKAAGAVSPSA